MIGGHNTLRGITIIEVTSEATTKAGGLLADIGAHVLLVEPAELATSGGRQSFRQLIEGADVLLEAEPPERLAEFGLDYIDLTRQSPDTGAPDPVPGPPAVNDQLIHVSISPFGRTSRGPMSMASRQQPMTEFTMQARAGWLDESAAEDATQRSQSSLTEIAAQMAVAATITALLARGSHGSQFVDISVLAAANTCAGPSTVNWLATRRNTPHLPRRYRRR